MDRKQYEQDLCRKKEEHLKKIENKKANNWQPCLHDQCPECIGTGVKVNGSTCIHMISCHCPKCSPRYY